MPRIEAVWGIDVGNCSLKALRCQVTPESERLVADAFDYIEYPQILTQPGAEQPAQLVADALQQFLSRNDLRGTSVAISVSGQNGLARFIKLPPVETRKIPDIVHYEARQQIPFDLNDVIWDYQRMGVGLEEEGFVLEAEIGLFAMKRDQVLRALEPFDRAGISVDHVQLAPLALYNYLVFDQLTDLPPPDEYDSENPPPSTVILSMGTDASDLVVTNGFRVWQRSIPIGGNHFTKALVKELKLTFAKAEHLKRNAASAPDPKGVFQAMRQVFNDLLTEVQRSISYYTTLDRTAKVQRLLAMGSGMKLPGLRRFLAQGLGLEVDVLESFRAIAGPEVLNAPAFKDNQIAFASCYGLALQGLGKSSIHTNLIPKEIVQDRIIRAKKPWAVAAAAVLLVGCTLSFVSYSRALATVDVKRFERAEQEAAGVSKLAKDFEQAASQAKTEMESTNQVGLNLVQNVEGRLRWLELLRAINVCLPRDPEGKPPPDDIEMRQQLHVRSLDCRGLPSTETIDAWLATMKQSNWLSPEDAAAAPEAGSAGTTAAAPAPAATAAVSGTTGTEADATTGGMSGMMVAGEPVAWLVTLQGYHYHNNRDAFGDNIGAQYVRNTLLNKLRTGEVILPIGTGEEKERVTMKELGVSHPVLINPLQIYEEYIVDPNAVIALEAERAARAGGGMASGVMPGMGPTAPSTMPTMPGAGRRSPYAPGSSSSAMSTMPGMMPGAASMGSGYPQAGRRSMPTPGGSSGGARMPGMGGTTGTPQDFESETTLKVRRFDFTVAFIWKPTTPSERAKKRVASPAQATEGQQPAMGMQPGVPGQPMQGGQAPPGAQPPTGALPGVPGQPMQGGQAPPGAQPPTGALPGVPGQPMQGGQAPPGAKAPVQPVIPGQPPMMGQPGGPGQPVPGALPPAGSQAPPRKL